MNFHFESAVGPCVHRMSRGSMQMGRWRASHEVLDICGSMDCAECLHGHCKGIGVQYQDHPTGILPLPEVKCAVHTDHTALFMLQHLRL